MNNNPFEPAATDPVSDDSLQTDDAADNFTADGGDTDQGDNIDVSVKTPLSIDGISPNYGTDTPDNDSVNNDMPGESDNITSDDTLTDNDNVGDFLSNMAADDTASDTEPAVEPASDEKPVPPVETKPEKSEKRVRISLLTIIFFILAVAGIAGAIYFFLQDNKNANALAESEAKVQQLQDELSINATAEGTSANQYDGLSDKIGNLSEKNEENEKTIDEFKKKNKELNDQLTKLTTENTDLKKKIANIDDLSMRIDKLLPILEDIQKNYQ